MKHRETQHPLHWEVLPAITASPSGLVVSLGSGVVEKKVLLRSQDGTPFQITGTRIDSARITAETSDRGLKLTHVVRLAIDSNVRTDARGATVSILTSHPSQSTIPISVYLSGNQSGR